MNIQKVILLLLFLNVSLHAQNVEFGKVTKQELEEKYHPIDTTAGAAL